MLQRTALVARLRAGSLGVAGAILLLPSVALAQQGDSGSGSGSKQLSLTEQMFSKQKMASICVTDGGRKIVDKIRLANALTILADAPIDNIDTNKDGALNDSEFLAYVSHPFPNDPA